MKLAVDPRSPVPLHAQITEQIQLAIARGDWQPGAQLPTVRQLSVALRVNSNTVARVYAELERAGVLETYRGRGTFVATRPKIALGTRERRLKHLCRTFVRLCSEEGYSLDEINSALEAMDNREVEK
jgi:GntR family transcriptional regulator